MLPESDGRRLDLAPASRVNRQPAQNECSSSALLAHSRPAIPFTCTDSGAQLSNKDEDARGHGPAGIPQLRGEHAARLACAPRAVPNSRKARRRSWRCLKQPSLQSSSSAANERCSWQGGGTRRATKCTPCPFSKRIACATMDEPVSHAGQDFPCFALCSSEDHPSPGAGCPLLKGPSHLRDKSGPGRARQLPVGQPESHAQVQRVIAGIPAAHKAAGCASTEQGEPPGMGSGQGVHARASRCHP